MSFGWLDVVDLGGISTARAWSRRALTRER
jgi:hypothetical protein